MKSWFCVLLIVSLSLPVSETRSVPSGMLVLPINSNNRTLMEIAKQALKASIQRNGGKPFDSKRVSPGGPDSRHH